MRMTEPRRQKKLHILTVRVNDTLLQDLKEGAEEENRPVSNLIATILRNWQIERHAKKQGEAG